MCSGEKEIASLQTFAEASIVPVVLVGLGIPLVVVAGSEMDEGFIAGFVNEIIEVKRFPAVPPVLTILPLVSPRPVVAGIAIARGVLLVHVVPQALHGVGVQDVSELCSEVVLTVGPAVCPVHHDGVGPEVSPSTTLSSPELRSRGGPNI